MRQRGSCTREHTLNFISCKRMLPEISSLAVAGQIGHFPTTVGMQQAASKDFLYQSSAPRTYLTENNVGLTKSTVRHCGRKTSKTLIFFVRIWRGSCRSKAAKFGRYI